MQHYFDIDIATEYGINAAIILENMRFWLAKNEANEANFHDVATHLLLYYKA